MTAQLHALSLFRVTAIAVLALALRGDTALAQRAGARVTAKPPIKAVFEVPALPDSVAVLDVIRDYGSALMGAPPDPNKAAMLFAPDGELLPPGVAPVVGRDSIRDMLAGFGKVVVEKVIMSPASITMLGRSAVVWGAYQQRVTPAGQKTIEVYGRFVCEVAKQPSGKWLIRRLLVQPS